MNRGPANQSQYDILKIFTSMPFMKPQKIARAFKLPVNVVHMVAASYSYENYKLVRQAKRQNFMDDLKKKSDDLKDQRTQEFMDDLGDIFGGEW